MKANFYRCWRIIALAIMMIPAVSTAQWVRVNGPDGGDANDLICNGSSLYAAVGGKVYLSTDSARSWNAASATTNGAVSILASDGKYIFAGGGSGLYRSSDNGTDWQVVGNKYLQSNVTGVSACGATLIASSFNGDVLSPETSICRSTDYGATWTLMNSTLPNATSNSLAFYVSSAGDTDIFDETPGGMFKSTDRGDSWIEISSTSRYAPGISVVPGGSNGPVFYSFTGGSISRSTDYGASWSDLTTNLSDTLLSAFAIEPEDSGDAGLFVGTQEGYVYFSSDNGTHWNNSSNGLLLGPLESGASIISLTVDGRNIFACTMAGIFLSTDNGADWQRADNGISAVLIDQMAVASDQAGNETVFAATFSSGIYASTDDGSDWTPIDKGMNSVYIRALVAGGGDLFAAANTGVFVSTDAGTSWSYSGLEDEGGVSYLLAVTGRKGGTDIIAGTGNGNFISTDAGSSWDTLGLGPGVMSMASEPNDAGGTDLFAGTNRGVFRSTDYGASWSPVNNGLPYATNVYALAAAGNNIFAGDDTLYVSSDNGGSWNPTSLPVTPNTWIGSIQIDTTGGEDSNVFAGTNDEGVFVSTDAGKTWHAANTGLGTEGTVDMTMDRSYLFVGGNSGLWRRPLSEMITSVQSNKTPVPSTFTLSQNYPNPFNPTTVIEYAIPKRGHVNLTIYDVLGRKVGTLVDGYEQAGHHQVGFNGSELPSGVYFYELREGSHFQAKKCLLLK